MSSIPRCPLAQPLDQVHALVVKRLCLASLAMAGWLLGLTVIGFLAVVTGPIGSAAVEFYSEQFGLSCRSSVSLSFTLRHRKGVYFGCCFRGASVDPWDMLYVVEGIVARAAKAVSNVMSSVMRTLAGARLYKSMRLRPTSAKCRRRFLASRCQQYEP